MANLRPTTKDTARPTISIPRRRACFGGEGRRELACPWLRRGQLRAARWAFVAASLLILPGCQGMRWGLGGAYGKKPVKAIWVTRWDYKSAADNARVIDNCKSAGFNTVLFQVRGNGTAAYRSRIEPWAEEFGGRDPGFDPLGVACKEAHRRGMQLHAWVNMIPGWRGDKPPSDPRQLYNAHREWFWRDASGRYQPLGWYVSVNPAYPEVRRYLVDVVHEVVSKYPIDGVHMDYIRFPNEWNESYPKGASVPDFPRDPRTLAMFKRVTGKSPEQAPAQWDGFRTATVTQVMRDVRKMMLKTKPRAALTTAVGASPEDARRKHFQDARQWIKEGLVDAVFPMNYAKDLGSYGQRLAEWTAMKPHVPVITGIMFDKRDGSTVRAQVGTARKAAGHFSAFAYNSLFERYDRQGRPAQDGQSPSRAALRRELIPYLRGI